MEKVSFEDLIKLRKKTGIGLKDCKEAIEESKGDIEKAIEILRKKGILKAQKRAGKEAKNGFIGSYVHNGQIGVLVELASETDFVGRDEKFRELAHNLALHIAAEAPIYISRDDVPEDTLEKEKEIFRANLIKEGKPEKIIDKIVSGQINKYYEEVCLLDQPFVKDEKKKIKDLIDEAVALFGEKIEIQDFVRMVLGEEEEDK